MMKVSPEARLRLFFCLTALSVLHCFTAFAPPRQYVQTVDDLERHFKLHISRVVRLGTWIYDNNPGEFSGVTRSQLEEFLSLHDQAKINSSAAFKAEFWVEPLETPPFIRRLFERYASVNASLPEAEMEKTKQLIANLNATDSRVGQEFFKRRGMLDKDGKPNEVARQLLRIERIADVVDRKSDPVAQEELSVRKERPFSDFLSSGTDLAIAAQTEARYLAITNGLAFPKIRRRSPCKELSLLAHP